MFGSAAARAQMAVKRKQERKQMYSFMAAEESSDEDDDMEVDERPECVTNMHPELAQLMSKQMNEFMKKLKDAVEDPGDNQENLEVLEETFDKLLYRGFVEGKGFYPLGHKHEHRAAATHEEEVAPHLVRAVQVACGHHRARAVDRVTGDCNCSADTDRHT